MRMKKKKERSSKKLLEYWNWSKIQKERLLKSRKIDHILFFSIIINTTEIRECDYKLLINQDCFGNASIYIVCQHNYILNPRTLVSQQTSVTFLFLSNTVVCFDACCHAGLKQA